MSDTLQGPRPTQRAASVHAQAEVEKRGQTGAPCCLVNPTCPPSSCGCSPDVPALLLEHQRAKVQQLVQARAQALR